MIPFNHRSFKSESKEIKIVVICIWCVNIFYFSFYFFPNRRESEEKSIIIIFSKKNICERSHTSKQNEKRKNYARSLGKFSHLTSDLYHLIISWICVNSFTNVCYHRSRLHSQFTLSCSPLTNLYFLTNEWT